MLLYNEKNLEHCYIIHSSQIISPILWHNRAIIDILQGKIIIISKSAV